MEGTPDLTAKNRETYTDVARCGIYKVFEKLRVDNEEKYEPHTVSIGPYHRHRKSIEITDNQKKSYLHGFLDRGKSRKYVWKDLVDRISGLRDAARKCYMERFDVDDEEFGRMLLLDGSFILELLCRHYEYEHQLVHDREDNIFDRTWVLPSIRHDLVLLENQIPFSILVCLFDLIHSPVSMKFKPDEPNCYPIQPSTLNELISSFFHPILPTAISADKTESSYCGHLLDVLRLNLLSPRYITKINREDHYKKPVCATDLAEAGVKFKKRIYGNGLLDIKFVDGVFAIPPFYFGESWTVLLRNIIALEQCSHRGDQINHDGSNDEITSYVILMNNLINSEKDVKLLEDKGIISSEEGDREIASEINNLCKNVIVRPLYYAELCQEVISYCETPYCIGRASLFRHVLNSPYPLVRFFVVVASCLLWLAITQSVLTLLSLIQISGNFLVVAADIIIWLVLKCNIKTGYSTDKMVKRIRKWFPPQDTPKISLAPMEG